MNYLNLTEGFNPYNAKPQDCISFEAFVFKGGEPHIKLDSNFRKSREEGIVEELSITIKLDSMDDLGLLLVAVEAINDLGRFGIRHLLIPYFPGARQDRRMVEGEPLTAKVFAQVINILDFESVDIFDAHSDVAPALLDNSNNLPNYNFIVKVLEKLGDPYDIALVSPDAGANKKILGVAQNTDTLNIIKCDKVRNVETGALTGFEVYADDLGGKPCLIVDDICDGGGTFLGLAEKLKEKNAGDLYLAVSHGIFSRGLGDLCKVFKEVFATDSVDTSRYTEAVHLNYHEIGLHEIL